MEIAVRPASVTTFAPAVVWNMSLFHRLLVGVAVLDISIQVDTYLFYQEDWAHIGAIGGVNVSLTTIFLAMLYALWLVEAGVTTALSRTRSLYINTPLTCYVGIATLSWFVADEKLLAFNSITLLLQSYLLYTYIANRVKSRADVVFILSLMAIALAIQGIVMIGLRIVGHDLAVGPVNAVLDQTPGGEIRVGGTIGSPVTGGSFLALMFAPTLSLLLTPVQRSHKLLAFAALGLGGIGLLLTITRGSWIATALSVSVFCLLAWYRGWLSLRLPVLVALGGLLLIVVFHDKLPSRLFGDDAGSAHSRLPLFQLAWDMICDNPLTGVGVNNCPVAAVPYAARADFRGEWFWAIHNKYLLEWVETGIFGLIAFLLFLLTTIRTGWHDWLKRDRLLSPIALALTLAICGQMIHMLVDVFATRPQIQSLWLCAALIVAISRIEGEQ